MMSEYQFLNRPLLRSALQLIALLGYWGMTCWMMSPRDASVISRVLSQDPCNAARFLLVWPVLGSVLEDVQLHAGKM